MPRSEKRLRFHLKSAKQQLAVAKRKGNDTQYLRREIDWIKAQQKLNAKQRFGSPILHVRRY